MKTYQILEGKDEGTALRYFAGVPNRRAAEAVLLWQVARSDWEGHDIERSFTLVHYTNDPWEVFCANWTGAFQAWLLNLGAHS